MNILFNPDCGRPIKRFRNDAYERSLCQLIVIGGKKGKGMVFTSQQAADILSNNGKVSADGSVNTHNDVGAVNPTIGDLLTWDGTNWVNLPAPVGGGVSTQQAADILSNNGKVSASGSINTHNDVQMIAPMRNGQILTWNGIEWRNEDSSGVTDEQTTDILLNNLKISADGSINTHNDVQTSTPASGDLLTWDGINWTNVQKPTGISPAQVEDILSSNAKISADGSVNIHNDVESVNPTIGEILTWDGVNWVNMPPPPEITPEQVADILSNNGKVSADGSINTHNDVQTSTPVIGQVLTWNGTNWINLPSPEGISTQQTADILSNNGKVSASGSINTHSDVQTTVPSIGQVLTWDGINWRNIPAPEGISAQQTADILSNNAKVSASGSVNIHNDVQYVTPAQGDLLTWNGTNWINLPPAIGVSVQQAADILLNNGKVSADGSVNTHNDVQTTTPATGQVLTWDGINWTNAIIPAQIQRFQPISVVSGLDVNPVAGVAPYVFSGGAGSARAQANTWNGLGGSAGGINVFSNENGGTVSGMDQLWKYPGVDPWNDAGYQAIQNPGGSGMALIGMEMIYNAQPPYANPANPTVPEQIRWCLRVINHYRFLLQGQGGWLFASPPFKEAELSQRLCNEALWEAERYHTTRYGTALANSLAATGFIPTLAQQAEYAGFPSLTKQSVYYMSQDTQDTMA
jgi:hypothetical protein